MNLGKIDEILQNSFSQKIRMLRQLYCLTLKEEAELLGLKSGGNITAMESGKTKPSYDTMVKIQALYGISIDWIMGFSDMPYNSITIEIALVQIKKKVIKMIKEGTIYPDFIVTLEDYYNAIDKLTIENQFNLILLQNYIIHDQKIGYENNKKLKTMNNKVILTLGKHKEYYENLDKIITENPQRPIYDLIMTITAAQLAELKR
jgi:transcriptional regulator with XRE-family HTH domain|nr:helix-turn-helix transcriptional regulator [uncultured Dialister sp.]